MKKKLLFILMIFVLTGCSATAKIIVSKDGKINENISIYNSKTNVPEHYSSYDAFLKDIYEFNYVDELENYSIKNVIDEQIVGMEFSKEDDDFCKNMEKSLFNVFFDESYECIEKDSYYELNAEGKYLICDNDCYFDNGVDSVVFELVLPSKAISSNAFSVNGNSYKWEFNKGDIAQINIKFKKYNTKNVDSLKDKRRSDNVAIFIIILLLLLALVVIKKLYDKYKKNRLKY